MPKERVEAYIPKTVKFFLETVASAYGMSLSQLCSLILIDGAVRIKMGEFVIDPHIAELATKLFGDEADIMKMLERGEK